MSHGGKREGAGRKKDSVVPKFSTYFTEEEMEKFVNNLKARADQSDKIAIFLAEHIWGKAHQTVDANLSGTLEITFDNAFTPPPKANSQ